MGEGQLVSAAVAISFLAGPLRRSMRIHLIQKRSSSELLHCALRIVAYPDRKAPGL